MDRCALFVDAGYVLTDGAMAVHGTRRRESVSWDYAGLLQLLGNMAMERARLPLLRCYWYEATVEGRRSADHDTLADLPGVKLRVAKMRPGRREGVEGEIHRDLTTLARNKAVSDVMVVSAEEDLAQVIADVQDMGLRVTLLHIGADGNPTIPRALRQECDDIVEISATQLRPYVELISGAEPPRADEADAGHLAPRPAMNGSAMNGSAVNGSSVNGHAPAAGRADARTEYPQVVDFGATVDYTASVDYGAPAEYAQAADHAPAAEQQASAVDFGSALDYGPAVDYGPVPDYAAPGTMQQAAPQPGAPQPGAPQPGAPQPGAPQPGAPQPVAQRPAPQPREDIYAAPVVLPAAADDVTGDRGRPRADLSAYSPGAAREQYQRESMLREPIAGDSDRLQPVPVALPGAGSAQVRRLPARGGVPGGPSQGQPPLGLPPAPADAGIGGQGGQPGQQPGGPPPAGHPMGGQPSVGQPTGGQPVVPLAPVAPVAPVVPMDPNGMGYAGGRGAAPGGPRHVVQGLTSNSGPLSVVGPVGAGQVPPSSQQPQQPQQPPQLPQAPSMPGGQQVPGGQQDMNAQSGPIGLVGPGGYSGGAPGVSLGDAVQSAHEEGQAFGESVARDAPALWLEAVLARKPRMPSDLEARLLQGSALPIDFLLHDEVRHALRRGFWDALERARR